MRTILRCSMVASALVLGSGLLMPAAAGVDADAAQALARKSECFKCHSVDKKKSGTPYREVAKKYKGDADAEDKLIKHITTKPIVEVDGKKEEHRAVKSSNAAEVRNLVQWILSH